MKNQNEQADALARALLIPARKVAEYMKTVDGAELKTIASVFGIPKDQAKIRLIELDYTEYDKTVFEVFELPGYCKKTTTKMTVWK